MSGDYDQSDSNHFDSSSSSSSSLSLINCSPTSEFSCLIDNYSRLRSYRELFDACSRTLSLANSHPEARFWRCFSQIQGNDRSNDTEAIRDLENLLHDVHNAPEFQLASTALLIIAHKKQQRADITAIEKYKDSLKSLSKTSDNATLLIAGRYFLHTDKLKQAKQCFDKIVNKSSGGQQQGNKEYLPALVYSCFLLSHPSNKDNNRGLKKALIQIEEILATGITDINALHCHANILLRQNRLNDSINSLNLIHVTYPNYLPCLVEKCSILFLLNNFDEALIITYKILKINPNNIFALFNLLIYFLCKEGSNSISIKERFNDLVAGLEKSELNEFYFYFYFGSILARMNLGSKNVLLMAQNLINLAINKYKKNNNSENNSQILLEQAWINELLGDSNTAAQAYSKASKSDSGENNGENTNNNGGGEGVEVSGLLGLTRIKISNLKYREALQELDLISELIENNTLNNKYKNLNYLNLSFLKAKISYEYQGDFSSSLTMINEFFDIFSNYLSNTNYNNFNAYEFYSNFQNELLMNAINLFLLIIPSEPRLSTESEHPTLIKIIKLLNEIIARIPGYFQAHLLKSKLFYLNGQLSEAEDIIINTCQSLDSNNSSLYILLSYIYFSQENYKLSSQSLEQARALDFEIRNTIDYHLLKTKLLFLNGQIEEAKQVALAAMGIIASHFNAIKNTDKRPGGKLSSTPIIAITRHDRLSIIVELAKCYGGLNDFIEADKLLNSSRAELNSPLESSRLTLATVDLAMTKKDSDSALTLLRSIDSDSPYYTRAKLKMADIYLNVKHNRKAYLACHQDLFTVSPTLAHQLLIADAYMTIQEPEMAIQMFEQAITMGGESELYSKIGRAMIATHDYDRACDYYEQAIHSAANNNNNNNDNASTITVISLLHELSSLLFKMRRYSDSQSVVDRALASINEIIDGSQSIKLLALKVECLLLDSEIALASGNNEKHLQSLNDCINSQNNLLSVYENRAVKNSFQYNQAKELAANLNSKLGLYYQQGAGQNIDQAIIYYTEALKHLPSHSQSLFNLSKIYYTQNQYEESKNQLIQLLRFNPSHSEAQLFLADLHYELANFEHCIYHLQNLMENNELKHLRFEACSKIIHILRRHGRLLDGAKILKSCEKSVINGAKLAGDKKIIELDNNNNNNAQNKANNNSSAIDGSEDTVIFPTSPGLHYCKGLYYYYCSHPRSALFHFNLARKSHDWGDRSLYYMIEIYLNPDHLELFSDVTAENEADKNNSKLAQNLNYARQLMTELNSHENSSKETKYQILENYILLSTKNKIEIEKSAQNCLNILNNDQNYVPALLCLANAYHLLQQPAKTRNYLKRISKMKLNHEYLIEFEKAFLFLAEIYLQIGKFELSTELCKKTLSLNKSNGKAWEIMGGIMEKEAAYKDAAENYEQAWYNSQQSDVNIGFKLAFNYLKCKKYVEAIDVCHQTLKLNPEQPKLKKEILEKARAALRP